MTDEERLNIALSGIPDDMAPDLDAKRNVWNVCSYAFVKMLDGLGDLAPNRFTYVFSYDDSESYEISVHRVRGESQLAALEKSNAALKQALEAVGRLTTERDEARAALAKEECSHGVTIDQRERAHEWADTLANHIAGAAGHDIGEHSNLNNPWDNAQDALVKLVKERDALRAERDELAATLANERGEGEPPTPGWVPLVPAPGRWEHPARNLVCYRIQTREYIVIVRGGLSGELAREKTARAAMRAAMKAVESS